ncbi:MAG TPA: hypothetical protein VF541_20015 [Longimicrobium sp.]|jgi:hypothetical protein
MSGDGDTSEIARRLGGALGWHGGAWLLLAFGEIVFMALLVKIF